MKKWEMFVVFWTLFSYIVVLIIMMSPIFVKHRPAAAAAEYYYHGITYQIRVVNGFTNNSSLPLVIWCASSEDGDIGGRALQEGDDYTWETRPLSIIWTPPAYSCTIKWDGTRKKFEAFHGGPTRCGTLRKCSWLVKEDGFYFSNDDSNWVKDFSWPAHD